MTVVSSALILVLLVFAFVFFVCAGFGIVSNRYNFVGLGLMCWVLAQILTTILK